MPFCGTTTRTFPAVVHSALRPSRHPQLRFLRPSRAPPAVIVEIPDATRASGPVGAAVRGREVELSVDQRREPRPLLITADPALLDDLLRLCAAAGVEPQVAHDEVAARHAWVEAPFILLGDDLAPRLVRSRVARRGRLVMVGLDPDNSDAWDVAVALGADGVVFLPAAQSWLLDRLADVGDGPAGSGTTVAVVGGRGGAGASTLAAALSVVAAGDGVSTMIIDVDPVGGGIDMLLGREDEAGLRWPDLAFADGRLSGESLRLALPRAGRLTMLSCGRGDSLQLPVEAARAVLDAAGRSHELVVVDLPRCLDRVTEHVLSTATVTLLVVPAEVRATAAAGRIAIGVGLLAGDLRVVVRGPSPGGLTGELVADRLGLPLAGWMDAEPDLAGALEHGRPPGTDRKGPLATLSRALLADVLPSRRQVA
jgi:secretion/DNA translocation related CpaE-like protein